MCVCQILDLIQCFVAVPLLLPECPCFFHSCIICTEGIENNDMDFPFVHAQPFLFSFHFCIRI